MTETTPEAPAEYDGPVRRAAIFHSDEGGEFSLPGYLGAIPSLVSDGTRFTFEGRFGDELFASDRFEETKIEEPSDESEPSPNLKLTKKELGKKLGIDDAEVDSLSKDDLVARADERDAGNSVFVPTPPPPSGDDAQGNDSTEDPQA